MDKNNFFVKSQIESDFNRVKELINSGVFNASVLRIFHESVFTELMIKLDDLLQKFNKLNQRIDFKDDISGDRDITDLVNSIRNAVCHMDSGEHILDSESQIKFTFNIAFGKGILISIGDRKLVSDYEDDVCFFFGENKIYFRRHIIKCIQESEIKLRELYAVPS